jgi:hypothetical protein
LRHPKLVLPIARNIEEGNEVAREKLLVLALLSDSDRQSSRTKKFAHVYNQNGRSLKALLSKSFRAVPEEMSPVLAAPHSNKGNAVKYVPIMMNPITLTVQAKPSRCMSWSKTIV